VVGPVRGGNIPNFSLTYIIPENSRLVLARPELFKTVKNLTLVVGLVRGGGMFPISLSPT
jgi:hypothetical protein